MRIIALISALLVATLPVAHAETPRSAEATVRGFMDTVRSGRDPDAAARFFAPTVQAHQLTSEGETTVERTPQQYADHVRGFRQAFGDYRFVVDDVIAHGDRVFVRWHQQGRHVGSIDGEAPTGRDLTEIGAAVYRVAAGRIVEYWILLDRKGLETQLARAADVP